MLNAGTRRLQQTVVSPGCSLVPGTKNLSACSPQLSVSAGLDPAQGRARFQIWRRRTGLLLGMGSSFLSLCAAPLVGQQTTPVSPRTGDQTYLLGPEDALMIHVKDEPEIPDGPYRIDLNGDVSLPEIGTIHAGGMSLAVISAKITERCGRFLKAPVVSVSVSEYRSQKVLVLGAVGTAGVQQIRGRKTLYEVLSEAGGLRPNAGGTIQISRRVAEGPLPLPKAEVVPSGQFETAAIDVEALMKAKNPQANIEVRPNDVITVPKAELIYVLGAVRKPGGFELTERQKMSVMQALSLAEGAERTAGTKHARILRRVGDGDVPTEIPLNLDKMIAGKQADVLLQPNDILMVPNSAAKSASYRALEAVVSTGSGVAIYHPY